MEPQQWQLTKGLLVQACHLCCILEGLYLLLRC